ncbi:MAG: YbfB/YjiJ family MFS transporter [Nocardioides sp.]
MRTAVAGGVIWGPVLGRLRAIHGPALVIAIVALGTALPLVSPDRPAVFASAALFGVSFLAVVTALTQVARQALHSTEWSAAIALLTAGFALGQCAGPVLSGMLADSGGIRAGLVLSVRTLAASSALCLARRESRDDR